MYVTAVKLHKGVIMSLVVDMRVKKKRDSPELTEVNPYICGRSLSGDCGFETRQWHGCLSLVRITCYHVVVSAMGRCLIRRSPLSVVCLSATEKSQ